MAPTTPAATPAQIQVLLDFLMEHQELARGLLRGADGRIRAKRLWEEVTSSLNAMGGCVKTMDQWQRVWSDKKFLSKRNAAAARKSACGTGGGPSTAPDLSETEIKILTIMGEGFGEPQTGATVPAFPLTNNSGVSTPHVDGVSPGPQVDTSEQQQPQEQLSPERLNLPSRPLQRRFTRRESINNNRQAERDSSVRGKLIKLEEERNEELRGIRAALVDLTNILKEVHTTRNQGSP